MTTTNNPGHPPPCGDESPGRNVPWEEILDRIARCDAVQQYQASVNAVASWTDPPDPFRVLLATIISLRTRDEVTFAAAERLFAIATTPEEIASLEAEQIEKAMYPAGFYRTKSRQIREIAATIVRTRHGRVPSSERELLEFPGVGRKTANLVRALGFGIPAICVDIHVHRISNRMGWVAEKTPDETERALMGTLPKRFWIPLNQWLVGFGRGICTPLSPRCSLCPVGEYCDRVGVTRSR
ncbi:endonuclease III domain-containing protein [Alkalispirochaeta alkalica]|uniref:endonuclease III domain-containing protein n=1 Tax=Alkalispirochaeta alkalica TaxID=46356 RepID=UPI00036E9E93|nr:endonuclease III [Alkalispirochaeta alkalica]